MAARTQASLGYRNAHRDTRSMYGNDYIQGSAAPKLRPQAAPKQETRPRGPSGSQSVRSNHRTCRNQERAIYMDLPYIIMLTIASAFTLYLCASYLHVQLSIATRMRHIEQIETELRQLRAENDALETSINTSIDPNKVYEIVTKELGMVYAKKDQVLSYDKTENEYVRQYEDIPEH